MEKIKFQYEPKLKELEKILYIVLVFHVTYFSNFKIQSYIITIIKAGQCFLIHGIPHHLVKREYQG